MSRHILEALKRLQLAIMNLGWALEDIEVFASGKNIWSLGPLWALTYTETWVTLAEEALQ